jgi:GMP synthase-like glutamine amidotransferase
MWIFVIVQDLDSYRRDGAGGGLAKARLEEASGEPCLVVPFERFSPRLVEELKPRAVAMSGFGGHFQDRAPEAWAGMHAHLQHSDLPTICFCGSHQLLGFSYDGSLDRGERLHDQPMRRLDPEEDLPRNAQFLASSYDLSGHYVADGFFPIRRIVDDPLFDGLQPTMHMCCSHYCEVKSLPEGFIALARSGHCAIEAMRHRTRTLYGTQFHPEAFKPGFDDGERLLRNFAAIVEKFWEGRAASTRG